MNLKNKLWIKFYNFSRIMADYFQYLFWLALDPSKFKRIKTSNIKNLLIIYGGAIGDAYNVIGLVNSLNKKYPKVNTYYLTLEKNRVFINSPKIKVVNKKKAGEMMREKELDAVILLQGATIKKELFSKRMYFDILKIPYRISCDSAQINPKLFIKQLIPQNLTRKVYTVNKNGFDDQVQAFRLLGFDLEKPEFYYTKEGEKFAKKFIKKHKIRKNEKLIFMHAGSGKTIKALNEGKVPSHLWPSENWAKTAEQLIKKYNSRIILTGVGSEKQIVDEIYSKIKNKKKVINATNKIPSIEAAASLFKRGSLLISIDTGVVHVGAQIGIPLVVIFGATPPSMVSPLTKKKIEIYHPDKFHDCRKYACSVCYEQHMKSITVNEILAAADKFLQKV